MIIIRVITENLAEELVLLPAPAKAPSVDNEQQRAYNTFCNSLACQDGEVFIMTSPIEVNVTSMNVGSMDGKVDYINPVTGKRCRPSKSLNLKVADNTKRKAQRILPEIKAQQAQEFLGHEDITTTMNIYTRCFNETKRHTSEIMNSIYAD